MAIHSDIPADGSIQFQNIRFSGNFMVWMVGAICAYLFLKDIDHAVDLALWDEAFYLSSAHSFGQTHQLPGANWAPLYTLWYFLLSLATPTPTILYYLNIGIVSILFPIAAIWMAMRFKVSPVAALLLGLILMTGYLNVPISPKPAHLALAILFTSIGWTTYISRVEIKLGVLSIGALMASFLRPELFLSFLLLQLILLGYLIVNYKLLTKGIGKFLLGYALGIGLLVYIFGLPLVGQDDRSIMAFGQHFALRWTQWNQSPLHPQLNWQIILKQNFGNAESYPQLIAQNPELFTKHIVANATDFVKDLRFVFYHYPFFMDSSKMAINGMITLVLFVGLVGYRIKSIGLAIKDLWLETVGIAVICIPSLISCIIIYPRMHYLLMVAVWGVAWLLVLACRDMKIQGCVPTVILPLTFLFWTPNAANAIQPTLKNRQAVDFIQSYQPQKIQLLESGAGLGFYFQSIGRFTMGEISQTQTPSEYIHAHSINTVFVDYYFPFQVGFSKQPLWKDWLNNGYKNDGFFKYSVAGNTVFLKTTP
ncbi:MAG: hypothetical protein K2Q22_13835 [Cytophagales bacterium]|nr:hypothetical protein [Cytophagales bacterium]